MTEPLCAYCGRKVREEDGWWLDDDDNLVCEASDESLGPHVPRVVVEGE